MRAALKRCSYGWNVFKRIINNRFSSSTVLFLTNVQQLKALISSEDCTNGGAFRVRHSSCHISVNRMFWSKPGNQLLKMFFSSCRWPTWLSLCSFHAVKVLACKHNNSTYAFSHTFSSGLFWEMLHLFP